MAARTSDPARVRPVAAVVLLVLFAASPGDAGGFLVFEQGAKAMGLANAFAAQADDPSALFFNPGGLAFFEDRLFQAGLTAASLGQSEFGGLPPEPGTSASGSQQDRFDVLPHFYWVEPLRDDLVFGLAVNSVFGFTTEWDDPDGWAGRFIVEDAELESLDLNPSLGWRATPRLGVAFGVVLRASSLDLRRREQLTNPATMMEEEVAFTAMRSATETALGWNAGLLHRVNGRVSWALTYRSAVEIDYGGHARLIQQPSGDPGFDALVSAQLPFDGEPAMSTQIEFPDVAGAAVGWQINPSVLLELDVVRVGWDRFDALRLEFPSAPPLDTTLVTDWEDATSYRAGWRWFGQGNGEWRAGLWFDETPQPAETLGPLFPDADRLGFSVGYGTKVRGVHTDLALMYVDYDARSSNPNVDGFNGSYDNDVALLGATLSW